jgi:hypothetical protein
LFDPTLSRHPFTVWKPEPKVGISGFPPATLWAVPNLGNHPRNDVETSTVVVQRRTADLHLHEISYRCFDASGNIERSSIDVFRAKRLANAAAAVDSRRYHAATFQVRVSYSSGKDGSIRFP